MSYNDFAIFIVTDFHIFHRYWHL